MNQKIHSKNISKFKNIKITPTLILLFIIIAIETSIIIYSNIIEIKFHLGYDASGAYLQAVEVWRCKSLVPDTYKMITTLGIDSPVPIAALLYGITNNIFLSYGITNLILDILITFLLVLLLKEFNVDLPSILLGIILLLCPFMTPDHYTDNNLSYYAMVLGEQGSYSIKVIAMLCLLLTIMKLEHNKSCYFSMFAAIFLNIITSISSGIYIAITILVPCFIYYLVKIIYKNSIIELKNKGFLFIITQLILSFILKQLSTMFFSFESKESSLMLTGIYQFWKNLGSVIMGYFQFFSAISINTTTSIFSIRGILQLVSISIILILFILFITSIKQGISNIKKRKTDFSFLLPHIIIFTNIAVFIFSYTLYDNLFFEYRYFIIIYLMQIIICCTAIKKFSSIAIIKNMILCLFPFLLLVETLLTFNLYHKDTIDNETINAIIKDIDSLDIPVAYVWGNSYVQMSIECRNLRVMDLNVVYKTMTNGSYKEPCHYGEYNYFEENSEWNGRTALITTLYDYYELPEYIHNKYTYTNSYGEYMIFVSDINPFDLCAFKSQCTTNINFMYTAGVNIINGYIDSSTGNLIEHSDITGEFMTMELPDVDSGKYDFKFDMLLEKSNDFSNITMGIYNSDTDELILSSDITSSEATIELSSTSNICLKFYKTENIDINFHSVIIEKK